MITPELMQDIRRLATALVRRPGPVGEAACRVREWADAQQTPDTPQGYPVGVSRHGLPVLRKMPDNDIDFDDTEYGYLGQVGCGPALAGPEDF